MSNRSHFIYTDVVQGYEDGSEPRSIFGKFIGYDVYLLFEKEHVHGIQIEGEYIILTVTPSEKMPDQFKIWGDAIIEFDYNIDGLTIRLEGGHIVTKDIIKGEYNENID